VQSFENFSLRQCNYTYNKSTNWQDDNQNKGETKVMILTSNLFTLGEFRVDRVEEMSGPFFPPSFLPGLPEDALAREAHWLVPKHFEIYGFAGT
jgi:hypothetical protein